MSRVLMSSGDGKLVSSQFLYSQLAPNIYIEHRTGFHTEPVGQFERFRSSEKEAAIGATAELRILDHTDGNFVIISMLFLCINVSSRRV
ncbi:unnamed protein product [Protopolystoma xenopodis]|uniref:Uncharacterized protein n=1 Tax=Protopolystoma xenopodis TaxID=117903 RepID=A0A448X0R1_9PLAT|nr:unnamed protein product [Protopolystoma xenopodis]